MRIGHHGLHRHFDHRSDERGRHTMSGDVHGQLHDQLVTAAYLWLDTGNRKAYIQRQGTRRFCAGEKASRQALKAMVCCSESTRRPTTPFVTYRSTLATASCFTQTA
jgi:hypothetical protein